MTQSATHDSELSCSVDLSATGIDDTPQASVSNAASGSEDSLFTTVVNNPQDGASGFEGFGFTVINLEQELAAGMVGRFLGPSNDAYDPGAELFVLAFQQSEIPGSLT